MDTILSLAATFLIVVAGAYLVTRAMSRSPRPASRALDVAPGTSLRLVVPGGAYRSRIQACEGETVRVDAPLHQDTYVPLRVGQTVVGQIGDLDSVLTFRTEVVARDPQDHSLILAQPRFLRRGNRRCEPRLIGVQREPASLDGERAEILDLSANGARVVTTANVQPGDRVRLDVPHSDGPAFGWALQCRTETMEGRMAREVRIQFEEPLEGLVAWRQGTRLH